MGNAHPSSPHHLRRDDSKLNSDISSSKTRTTEQSTELHALIRRGRWDDVLPPRLYPDNIRSDDEDEDEIYDDDEHDDIDPNGRIRRPLHSYHNTKSRLRDARTWLVHRQSKTRALPLHLALQQQSHVPLPVIEYIVQLFPDAVRLCDPSDSMLALHWAAWSRQDEAVINYLADQYREAATARDRYGRLPMHIAAEYGVCGSEVINVLLHANPYSLTERDVSGRTPLDIVLQSDYQKRMDGCVHELASADVLIPLLKQKQLLQHTNEALPIVEATDGEVGSRSLRQDGYSNSSKRLVQQMSAEGIKWSLSTSSVQHKLRMAQRESVYLHELIQKQKWDAAMERIRSRPEDTAVWHSYNIANVASSNNNAGDLQALDLMVLPLHRACRQFPPNVELIKALLAEYPDAVGCRDSKGTLPLTAACYVASSAIQASSLSGDNTGQGASFQLIQHLINTFPGAVCIRDQFGRLPVHIFTCPPHQVPGNNSIGVSIVKMLIQKDPQSLYEEDNKRQRPVDFLGGVENNSTIDSRNLVAERSKEKSSIGGLSTHSSRSNRRMRRNSSSSCSSHLSIRSSNRLEAIIQQADHQPKRQSSRSAFEQVNSSGAQSKSLHEVRRPSLNDHSTSSTSATTGTNSSSQSTSQLVSLQEGSIVDQMDPISEVVELSSSDRSIKVRVHALRADSLCSDDDDTTEEHSEVENESTTKCQSTDPTELMLLIEKENWAEATLRSEEVFDEAGSWHIRYDFHGECWLKQLPVHAAVMRSAPFAIIISLLQSYPIGAGMQDHMGRLPLHWACDLGSEMEVIDALVSFYPEAITERDFKEMTPLDCAQSGVHDAIVAYLRIRTDTRISADTHFTREIQPPQERHAKVVEDVERPCDLLRFIELENWIKVMDRLELYPDEAGQAIPSKSSMMPLHRASQLRPPVEVIKALIQAAPQAVKIVGGEEAMLPIHFACAYGASSDTISALLQAFPDSTTVKAGKFQETPAQIAERYFRSDEAITFFEREGVLKILQQDSPKSVIQVSMDESYH